MEALFIGALILMSIGQAHNVYAPLFTARLYDYGSDDGDELVTTSIDVGAQFVLRHPITFYGRKYNDIVILSNGGVGVEQNSRNYRRNILRESSSPVLVSLWNRNDLHKGGQIFYREITMNNKQASKSEPNLKNFRLEGVTFFIVGRPIERGQSEIRYQYDLEVRPISMVIITWLNMQPFGDKTFETERTNTVQMALINTENGTFANFIYKKIAWSYNAEAGFSGGQGYGIFSLPSSGTENVVLLKEYGNTGIPGEWMFKIDGEKIIRCKAGQKGDTCDEECARNEWGHDCSRCCHCLNGKCDPVNGICESKQCKKCWTAYPTCHKRDPACSIKSRECGSNAIAVENRNHCSEHPTTCQCLSGFSGNGYNCTDINECLDGRSCAENAQCINTEGSFICQCPAGLSPRAINKGICVPDVSLRLSNTINLLNGTEQGAFVQDSTTSSSVPIPNFVIEATTSEISRARSRGTTSLILEDVGQKPTNDNYDTVNTVKFLLKETNSHLLYNLARPIQVFGHLRDKITIWSTGIVALGDVSPIDPGHDLYHAKVTGFAPLFSQIDLGQPSGNVFMTESTDAVILAEVARMIRNHSQMSGFKVDSLLTVTYQNVTSPTGKGANTFEVVLISGHNQIGENVTYVAFVYNEIDWVEDAKAMILHDDPLLSLDLLGPEPDDIRQLDKLSNIGVKGEWIFRIDKATKIDFCLNSEMESPLCDRQMEKPQHFSTQKSISTTKEDKMFVHPLINFDNSGETITFPPFVTLVPQLVTAKNRHSHLAAPLTPFSPLPSNQIVIKPITTAEIPVPNQESGLVSGAPADVMSRNGEILTVDKFASTNATSHTVTGQCTSDIDIQKMDQASTRSFGGGDESNLPPLQLFTIEAATTNNLSRPHSSLTKSPTKALDTKFGLPPKLSDSSRPSEGRRILDTGKKQGKSGHLTDGDEDESLNSSGKLAVIIPAAIVGVWMLMLFLIGAVVCIRRRTVRKKYTTKYDPSAAYLRSMTTTSHPAAVVLQQPQNKPHTNGYSTSVPHSGYHQSTPAEDRLTEMYQHGRLTSQTSYSDWNSNQQQHQPHYGYHNQSYYDSYPDVSQQTYRGHY